MCIFVLVKTSSNRMWQVNVCNCVMFKTICYEFCLYPCCLGPCNKNILKSPDRTCIIDEMNLSMRDYLMYNFKLNFIYENFSDTNL